MREAQADLWTEGMYCPTVITTNGAVRKDGAAVMGRGCALEAKQRLPLLPAFLGAKLQSFGNHVHTFRLSNTRIVTFPVKHHWRQQADLELLRRSAEELVSLTNRRRWVNVVMPRPGCGNGGRDWNTEVKPILEELLDDRFTVCHK